MSDNNKFLELLLHDRYYRDGEGTWEELCERVARFLSDVDHEEDEEHTKKYEQYKKIMLEKKFLPASPTLMSAGTNYFMGASCFVFDIEDTLESIMNTVKLAALVFARGGGCGYSLSALRPKGAIVSSTGTKALGPEGVIRLIDTMTSVIKQLRRRGANMAVIASSHFDVERFIDLKRVDGTISNFNLSVSVTDEFMAKVKAGEKRACRIWNKIIENALSTGDPGVIFIDTARKASPYTKLGLELNASNPCVVGDTLVAVADGRNYVSIKQLAEEEKDVLVHCVDPKTGESHVRMGRNPRMTREDTDVYKVSFDDGSCITVTEDHKFLKRNGDRVETKNLIPGDSLWAFNEYNHKVVSVEYIGKENVYNITVDEFHTIAYITDANAKTRKLGMPKLSGVYTSNCGEQILPNFGNCLLGSINLSNLVDNEGKFQKKEFRSIIKIAYDMLNSVLDHSKFPSPEILEFAVKYRPIGLGIAGFSDMLIKMAIVYGSEESYKMAEYIGKTLRDITNKLKIVYKNTTALTIAPTGSISILMGCSFGIEPNYAYRMDRPYVDNDDVKHSFKLVSPLLEEGRYKKECFVTSIDVTPEQHIEIQAIFQKYIDSSISKTIILPHDYTLEQTKGIFLRAYEKKCKGITIYRDMSKKDQVYTTSDQVSSKIPNHPNEETQISSIGTTHSNGTKKRPKKLPGYTYKCKIPSGSFYITVTYNDSTAFEVFATANIDDKDNPQRANEANVHTEALTRIISLALRSGVSPDKIVQQLEKVKNQSMLSMPHQLANILKETLVMLDDTPKQITSNRKCNLCGQMSLEFSGDCWCCSNCGWSKCE